MICPKAQLLIESMMRDEEIFHKASRQIIHIDNMLEALRTREKRARQRGCMSASYSLRMNIVTVENFRHFFWEYMDRKADKLDDLYDQLLDKFGIDYDDVVL